MKERETSWSEKQKRRIIQGASALLLALGTACGVPKPAPSLTETPNPSDTPDKSETVYIIHIQACLDENYDRKCQLGEPAIKGTAVSIIDVDGKRTLPPRVTGASGDVLWSNWSDSSMNKEWIDKNFSNKNLGIGYVNVNPEKLDLCAPDGLPVEELTQTYQDAGEKFTFHRLEIELPLSKTQCVNKEA